MTTHSPYRAEVPAPPATPPLQPPTPVPPIPATPQDKPVPIDDPRAPGAAEPVREPTRPTPMSTAG